LSEKLAAKAGREATEEDLEETDAKESQRAESEHSKEWSGNGAGRKGRLKSSTPSDMPW